MEYKVVWHRDNESVVVGRYNEPKAARNRLKNEELAYRCNEAKADPTNNPPLLPCGPNRFASFSSPRRCVEIQIEKGE